MTDRAGLIVAAHCIAGLALAACAAPPPSPYARLGLEEPSPPEPPRKVDPSARLADGRPLSSWSAGQPVPCRTVDDCRFAAPTEVYCPGCCGFCEGSAVVPRDFNAVRR